MSIADNTGRAVKICRLIAEIESTLDNKPLMDGEKWDLREEMYTLEDELCKLKVANNPPKTGSDE